MIEAPKVPADLTSSQQGLPDLTRTDLSTLLSTDSGVLSHAIRSVLSDIDQAQEVLSAHSSYAE